MSTVRTSEPRLYGSRQRLVWGGLFGLIGFPIGVTVALAPVAFWLAATGALIGPLVWPGVASLSLTAVVLMIYFPVSMGNPYVARLARKYPPRRGSTGVEPDLVQLVLNPTTLDETDRLLDDADDHGWLELEAGQLRFYGDHTEIELSWEDVSALRVSSVGWRGFWLSGHRVTLELVSPVDGFERLELASRKGNDLFSSFLASRALVQRVREAAVRAGRRVI